MMSPIITLPILAISLFGAASSSTSLSFVREPPQRVAFTNTTGAYVECSAMGAPTPFIEWLGLDQSPVGNIPGLRQVWPNGTLAIHPFSGTQFRQDVHSGVFQCRARNPAGIILAPPTSLRAVVVQDLEVRLYDEFVLVGNTAVLTCVVPSFMKDLVSVTAWIKDESFHIYPSVEGDGKHHALGDGRLLIFDVDSSETYVTYRCRATHRVTMKDALSNSARIVVKYPTDREAPKIVTKSETVQLDQSESVAIPCVAHAYPLAKYKWYLNRKGNLREPINPSDQVPRTREDLRREEVFIFRYDHETLRHSSRQTKVICEAYNDAGLASMEVVIERSEGISVEISPKLLTLDASKYGEFSCRVSGRIGGTPVTWYKNGQLLSSNDAATIKDGGRVLEIRRADRHSEGMYQCFVRGRERLYQASSRLRLGASPPELSYRFIQQTLTPGPAVSLKCISGGSPTPTISWTLDGFPLPQSDRLVVGQYVNINGDVVSHVNISRSRVEDGGEFSCTATNVAGSTTHSAPLYIYGAPYIRDMGTMTAVAGESFKVKCPVAGYPVPTVSWTKGSRELPLTRRHSVSSAELNILKVNRATDEGKYTCVVSDRQGRTVSKTLDLRVVEPPKVAPFTLPQALTAGSRVAVQCVVLQGDPPVGLQWYHNRHLAHKTHGVTVTPLGQFVLALVIDQIAPIHAGNYTCKATSHHAASSDSHSAYLRVHVPPVIKSFDFGVLISGMRTQVTCLIQTGDPPIKITWLQNDRPLATNSDIVMRQLDSFSSSLTFPSVHDQHSGNYTCVAGNEAKEVRHTAELLVRVAPHWKIEPSSITVIKGSDAMLSCSAGGFPTPTLTWRKTTKESGNKQNLFHHTYNPHLNGAQTLSNGSLLLTSVTEEVEGSYLCEASNGVGMDISSLAQVDIQVPPVVNGEERIEVHKGDSLTLRCTAKGDSPLTLSLAKNGQLIDMSDVRYSLKIRDSHRNDFNSEKVTTSEKFAELSLSGATSMDTGEFTCTATNPFGSDTHHTKVIVLEAPSSPRNLRVINEGSRFVTVSWTPPHSPITPILNYLIFITNQEDVLTGTKVRSVKVDGNVFSSEIQDLLPAKTYQIRISAVNSVGESPPSEVLTIQTKGEPPSSPPQNVRASSLSPTKVKVEWSAPDPDAVHGHLRGFYVGVRLDSQDKSEDYTFEKVQPTNGNAYSWSTENLQKYTRYEFAVQAFNDLGPGPLSRAVHAITHEDVPEAAPRDVNCVALTSKRLDISWSPPPEELTHGKIISYDVIYASLEKYSLSPYQETRVLAGTNTILSNLKPYTNYSITVSAATKAGLGKESDPITCFTEEDVPDEPESIKALVGGANDIAISWSSPQNVNGLLTKFSLYFQMTGSKDVKRRMIPAHGRDYVLSNLPENKEVSIWLTASTRVGEGLPSSKVTVIPSASVPAGIKAVDKELRVAEGTDVYLSCPTVGIPTPILTWKKYLSNIEQHPSWNLQSEGGLLLHDSKSEHSGNYSCHARNQHGEDSVIYSLIVMVPPEAPHLQALGSTFNSVTLTWTLGKDGGAPINQLILTWRQDREEWKELSLQRYAKSYTLKNLSCGSSHHFYLTPHNEIVSDVMKATHYEYPISDLRPATDYEMEIIATNPAGKTTTRYSFRTQSLTGDLQNDPQESSISIRDRQWIRDSDILLTDPTFIVPVILSCVAVIVILVSAIICLRRKTTALPSKTLQTCSESKPTNHVVDYHHDNHYFPTIKKMSTPPCRDADSIDTAPEYPEDIYPYATFQLQQQSDGSTLQTLVFQDPRKPSVHTVAYRKDCNERKPNGHNRSLSSDSASDYARVRKGRRRGGPGFGGLESEESLSDTDTDFAPSTRTESSSRIDGRNAHQNMLYLTSDASTIPSPPNERKSFPCPPDSRLRGEEGSRDRIYGITAIRDSTRMPLPHLHHSGHASPSVGPSRLRKGSNDPVEYSETECDRDVRHKISKLMNYNSFAV